MQTKGFGPLFLNISPSGARRDWAGHFASTPHVLHASQARGLRCRMLYERSFGPRVSAHGVVALQRGDGLI